MTFERPFALALLVAVPIAWWLSRNRRGATVVRVASLLAFSGAENASPSAAPRRAIDWRLVFVLTAMTLLALAAAGPQFGATRPAAFYVIVDDSPSMSARTCDAVRRAELLLHESAPDAERDDHPLGATGVADGLQSSLAPLLERARADGFPGVVLVTDAGVTATAGIAVVGPSAAAKSNIAVSSASLDGNEAVVAVRNYGPDEVVVRLRCADVANEVVVPSHSVGSARFAAPDGGELATFEIEAPADDFAADDRLVVVRGGGVRRVRLVSSAPCPRLEAALRAAGADVVRDGAAEVAVGYRVDLDAVVGRSWPLPKGRLSIAPNAGADDDLSPLVVRGDSIVGHDRAVGSSGLYGSAVPQAMPAPSSTLVLRPRLASGTTGSCAVLWSSGDRAVVVEGRSNDGTLVMAAVDPEDPRSDWHRDPSFPAFIAAALDELVDGPDRLGATYAIPASESDVVRDPPKTSSPDELRAAMRPAGPVPDAVRPARWLALAGAVLLAVAAIVRGR